MAKFITPDEFIKLTNGKKYDIDHAEGVQCVDGIKEFTLELDGSYDFVCGNNWAYGLWTNYGKNGVEKYFDKVAYKDAVKGDWIVWNKGSTSSCPKSHVAMYVSEDKKNATVKAYGQNQFGKAYFSTANIGTKGILGVLRSKTYLNHIVCKKNDNNKTVGKIDEFLEKKVKGTLYGDYTESCVKVFQKKNNLKVTGNIDFITYQTMKKEGL